MSKAFVLFGVAWLLGVDKFEAVGGGIVDVDVFGFSPSFLNPSQLSRHRPSSLLPMLELQRWCTGTPHFLHGYRVLPEALQRSP